MAGKSAVEVLNRSVGEEVAVIFVVLNSLNRKMRQFPKSIVYVYFSLETSKEV